MQLDPPLDRAGLDAAVLCWPAEREAALRGWSLRTGASPSLRANSAFPYAADADTSDEMLELLEGFFRERARVPAIRVVPFGPTLALDARLEEAGYALLEPTLVLTAALDPAAPAADPDPAGIALDDAGWLEALSALAGQPPRVRAHYAALLPRAPRDRIRVALAEDGRPVAVALGLLVEGWVGLFDLVVAPDRRGRGLGRRALRAALAEATRRGATRAFLYAQSDNERAIALHTGLGFREAYGYHYRVLR